MALVFMSFDDLMIDFAKDHDIHKWFIIIASHEICGSLATRGSVNGVSTAINYESKYDNIEFCNSLRPTPNVMEYACSNDRESFVEMYTSQLINSEPYMDLCALVDMVVEGYDVIVLFSSYEYAVHIQDVLQEFIADEFGITSFIYDDLKRLSENYGKDIYKKLVDSLPFEVPDTFTGRNFEVIFDMVENDTDEIKENLKTQKIIATSLVSSPGEENDLTSVFFNVFTENLEDKLREVLEAKEEYAIKELCRQKNIRIPPSATKSFLVDKILHAIKKNAAREIEYEVVG